jgi:hypothetical protein
MDSSLKAQSETLLPKYLTSLLAIQNIKLRLINEIFHRVLVLKTYYWLGKTNRKHRNTCLDQQTIRFNIAIDFLRTLELKLSHLCPRQSSTWKQPLSRNNKCLLDVSIWQGHRRKLPQVEFPIWHKNQKFLSIFSLARVEQPIKGKLAILTKTNCLNIRQQQHWHFNQQINETIIFFCLASKSRCQ